MRIFATVSYKGTNYQGWQKQNNAITVQGEIEKVISQYFNAPITIYASGRTDAGVHAFGQTFHFDVDKQGLDFSKALYSLNLMLPNDIKILELKEVGEDFQARYSAKEKIYCYKISLTNKDPFEYETYFIENKKIDINILLESLTHFIGKKCFKNFTSKEEDADGFVREIYEIKPYISESSIVIQFRGNGFMRYMIRDIVGTCLAIAEGREDISFIDKKLNSEVREIVSYKAEPQGLYLVEVKY